jgi:hypothetical protein
MKLHLLRKPVDEIKFRHILDCNRIKKLRYLVLTQQEKSTKGVI